MGRRRMLISGVATVWLVACGGGGDSADTAPVSAVAPANTLPPLSTAAPTVVASTTTIVASTTTTSTTTSTTTVAPSTTQPPPITISTAEAAAQYEEFAGAINAALSTVDTETDVRKYCTVMAPATETFAVAVSGASWPGEIQPSIDAMVSSLLQELGVYQSCATSGSLSPAIDDIVARSIGLSREIRLALGLTLNPE